MFSEVNGLPLHPLAVHASVVLVPLSALLGILFVIPRFRAWSRVPLVLCSLGSVVSIWVSMQTGEKFKDALGIGSGGDPVADLIEEHQKRAGWLLWFMVGFAVIAVVAFVLSRNPASMQGSVSVALSVLLVVGAGLVAFQTYRVGDIGSKAVWNPTGDRDYSGDDGG